MAHTVVFVDDDARLVLDYAEAVEESGMVARRIGDVDAALRYLQDLDEPADAIVWDMMMPPGQAFAHEDTMAGLLTGHFFFERARSLRSEAIFILLTNLVEDLERYHRPEVRSFACAKIETSPSDLAALIGTVLGDR